MREILFRGVCNDRREKCGGWIYGSYLYAEASGGKLHAISIPSSDPNKVIRTLEIIPATLGQYTGQRDKNGQKIFEGDLVEWDGKSMDTFVIVYGENASFFGTPVNGKLDRVPGEALSLINANLGIVVVGHVHGRLMGG